MNSQFFTLVKHFFGRFFDVDSTSPDADSRARVIQFLALLSVPGLMISFFMMGDHPAVSMFGRGASSQVERLWLRLGDRYVFVAYAMIAMGLLMAFKWDSLFPDRRDYLILTSLPISLKRWFAAKVVALFSFLGLFIIAINIFSLLLVPPLVRQQSNVASPTAFVYAFAAHATSTLGGSVFAALFFGALQGVLINILTPQAFKRISPRVQMISIALLMTLLLVIPLVKESIPALAQSGNPLLDYFPLMWFLGLYEVLIPGGTLVPQSIVWAYTGIKTSFVLSIVFIVSYAIGYRRHSRKVLEGEESETFLLRSWKGAVDACLHRTFLRDPVERGTFHFIEKVSTRSSKHRILTALYFGAAIALALSSLFVLDRRIVSGFPFRLSSTGALSAPLILAFVLISGLRATFNVPCELNANWMFQTTGDGNSPRFLQAIRKWVFLYRVVPLFACVAVFEFAVFPVGIAVRHLSFDLVVAALLIEGFFFKFSKVPFTCSYSSNKFQLVGIAAGYLYGFTMFVALSTGLKSVVTAAPSRLAAFMAVAAVVFFILRKRRRSMAIIYRDDGAGPLSLSIDRGYWKPAAAPVNRVHDRRYSFGGLQDFRHGVRILWKSPGLSATAIMLIAIVIGGNTTVFSFFHAFINRPAAGVTADRLVTLGVVGEPGEAFHPVTEFLRYQEQAKTIRPLVAISPERFTLALDQGSYGYLGAAVTANYFQTLGVTIIRGRRFSEEEDRRDGSALVAVISEELWRDKFQRSMQAIGQSVTLNGHPATIIGVAAPKFHGAFLGGPEDVWVPLVGYSVLKVQSRLSNNLPLQPFGVAIVGQLAPGTSLARAQAELATLSSSQQDGDRGPQRPRRVVEVIPYAGMAFGGSIGLRLILPIFSIVTLLTLIVVCANVANLMLSRAAVRRRETAVRQALGASRARIVGMLLAEGATISALAWVVACVVAYWTTRLVTRMLPTGINPRTGIRMNQAAMDLSPDWQVLAYAMVLACIGTIVFSIVPVIQTWRQELLSGLKTGEHGIARGRSMFRRALVLAQIAFSVVLLMSAGLVYRSFAVTNTFDLGFNKSNLLLVNVNPTLTIPNRDANLAVLEALRDRFRTLPGISSVSYGRDWTRGPIWTPNSPEPIMARINYVGPEYLRVFGLTPKGREFTAADRGAQNNIVMINQNLAGKLWPKADAIGQVLVVGRERRAVEVVGVVPNAFFSGALDESRPDFVFLAEQQDQSRVTGGDGIFESGETTFYLRYSRDLDSMIPLITRAIRDVDPRVPLTFMRTMDTQLAGATTGLRIILTLLTVFAGMSLLIAAIGQYAVVAFDTKSRTRELGVRVAMGASSRQILTGVLKEGLMLTGIGLLIGFGLSAAMAVGLSGFLPGVEPNDPRTYLGVSVILGAASILACYLPARRASRVDPLVTLRHE
jgi:macrolide transport system ATP-binding/permease protein